MSIPGLAPAAPLILLLLLVLSAAGGCSASSRVPPPGQADFVFVYLKSGPTSGQGTKEERSAMFGGHMANIQRLANEHKLVIAGPFNKPRDKSWRGIFVLDVPTVAEAQALAATDPGIKAGEFVTECIPMRASDALRQTLDLENAMLARPPANPPKPGIRPYVMVTAASDSPSCAAAIARAGLADKIIWSGRFSNHQNAGVFVLDAEKADDVSAALDKAGASGLGVDGWWSSAVLVELPSSARQ